MMDLNHNPREFIASFSHPSPEHPNLTTSLIKEDSGAINSSLDRIIQDKTLRISLLLTISAVLSRIQLSPDYPPSISLSQDTNNYTKISQIAMTITIAIFFWKITVGELKDLLIRGRNTLEKVIVVGFGLDAFPFLCITSYFPGILESTFPAMLLWGVYLIFAILMEACIGIV